MAWFIGMPIDSRTSKKGSTTLSGHAAIAIGLFAAYYFCARLGLALGSIETTVSLVWPASGIAAAAFYRFGLRFLPVVFFAALTIYLPMQQWPIAIGIALGNTAAPALCAIYLRRTRISPRFDRGFDVQTMAMVAVTTMLVSALNGTVWLLGAGRIDPARFAETALLWLLGDAAGVLIAAPILLAWPDSSGALHYNRARCARLAMASSVLVAACAVLYLGLVQHGLWMLALVFVPFIAIIRVAAAEGAWPASLHIAIVIGFVIYAQLHSYGPVNYLPVETRPYGTWGFLTALAIASLLTSGIIGERERAVRQLQTGEANYKALIEDNPALICRFHSDGRLAFANETFRRTFGIETGHSAGVNFFEQTGLKSDGVFLTRLHEARASDSAVTTDACLATTRFGERTFRWTARVVKESSGHGVEYHAVGLDVTDQLQAESRRRRVEAQALQTQRLESVGVLAGGIAHEFNNLLTSVMGNAELAQQMIAPGSDAAALLGEVRAGAVRAAGLTQQLLNYSGHGIVEPGPVDLSELVRGVHDLLTVAVPKSCPFQLDLAEGIPLVNADEARIRQLLMSLVSNAGEAARDARGPVIIRTSVVHFDPQQQTGGRVLGDTDPGWRVMLEVEDRGTGMNRNVRSRLFEPFFTTRFPGRGLGLAAVLGIVRDHGGAITVCSRVGYGTRVRVFLPTLDHSFAGPTAQPAHSPQCEFCIDADGTTDETPVDGYPLLNAASNARRTGRMGKMRSSFRRFKKR